MGEMKCPLCGGRMLRGHLSAGAYSRIIWTKSDLRWTSMLDAGASGGGTPVVYLPACWGTRPTGAFSAA